MTFRRWSELMDQSRSGDLHEGVQGRFAVAENNHEAGHSFLADNFHFILSLRVRCSDHGSHAIFGKIDGYDGLVGLFESFARRQRHPLHMRGQNCAILG
jgi:hypothetical protein